MLANVGRTGYFGCLVLLGVVMLSVSCLAVFGATGAITAERGARVPVAAAPRAEDRPSVEPTGKSEATLPAKGEEPLREPGKAEATKPSAGATGTATAAPTTAAATREAAKPSVVPQGTVPPKVPAVGPE